MRTKVPFFTLLFAIVGWPLAVQAQEIDLPEYTTDQRWTRAARFGVNGQVTLISLGKDQGMSVAEIGEWVGNFYKQGWTEGPREPSAAVVAFYRNQKVFPTGEMEVVEVSDDAVTVRFNRPHLLVFGDDMVHYGVTVDEYEEVMKIAQDIIGDWIGLDLDQRIDGNWWYVTFKRK